MTKVRLNLRKVATIIACLAVTAIFATCDKPNGGGKNDSKVVGTWTRHNVSPLDYYNFVFDKNGNFNYYILGTLDEYSYKGNYSVSDGKIYFTNVVFTNGDYKNNEPNSHAGYKIEVDKDGDLLRLDSSVGQSFMGATTWRRAK
jgi:hypothetical protein